MPTAKAALHALPSTVTRDAEWIKLEDAVTAMDDMTNETDMSAEAKDFLAKNEGKSPLTWQEAAKRVDKACRLIRDLAARLAEVEAERNVFRAVLEGAQYRDIDSLPRHGPEHAFRLGNLVAVMTMKTKARAEAAEAKLDVAREALQDISRQKKTGELEAEYDLEGADFEGGYDMCIDRARRALATLDTDQPDTRDEGDT